VYEQIGSPGASALASYTLNTAELSEWSKQDGLARSKVLERFQQALKVARGFKEQYPREGATLDRIVASGRFFEYLTQNLPGYNHSRCPVAGACLANQLRSKGQFVVQHSAMLGVAPRAGHIFQCGADIMGYMRCDYESQELGTQPIPAGYKEIMSRLLVDMPEAAERAGINDTRQTYNWPLFELLQVAGPGYTTVGLYPGQLMEGMEGYEDLRTDKVPLNVSSLFGTLALEAHREQLWHAEGPWCFCHPSKREECQIKASLAEVWRRTARDPEWEGSESWKRGDPPECIKDLI
jgi:hypothetical protein